MSKTVHRRVEKIIDGDTFKVYRSVNGSRYIRIAGINTPEKWQYGYSSAKQKLSGIIGGKVVTIEPVGRSYGRTVAHVSRYGNITRRMKK